MEKSIAIKEILLMQIESSKYKLNEIIEFFMDKNLPQDIINHLTRLWEISKEMGNKTIEIGKIILVKIYEFIKANPMMSIGMLLGAIAGYFATFFVSWIPFLGQLLSMISVLSGMFIGAVSGHMLDKIERGDMVDESILSPFTETLSLVKEFSKFLIDVFKTIFENR